ncbi:MAG: Energy-coupling factor transporter transmembrane protein EcfT [Pelotomaculum sp. PtaB.Bin104]|nr:MAG: Energy-coupling factor transporter transmembrane protein EcfT [Pelotomaculum sp. PtaB.Bin104]
MLTGITFGQFIPGNSIFHRLDPRTKVICVLATAISIIIASKWYEFALLAALTMGLMFFSRLSARLFFGGLRSFWVLLAITFLVQVLFTPGEVLAGLGWLKVSREGLVAGGIIFIRLSLLILVASLLTLTTSPISLTAGLESLLTPLKRFGLPAHELAMMMTIALRFIPTLLAEAEIVIKAQQSRGARLNSGGIVKRAKSLLPLFVPLFAGALRRAEELAIAMEARCYRGGANRTRMNSLVFGLPDYITISVSLVILTGAAGLKFWRY